MTSHTVEIDLEENGGTYKVTVEETPSSEGCSRDCLFPESFNDVVTRDHTSLNFVGSEGSIHLEMTIKSVFNGDPVHRFNCCNAAVVAGMLTVDKIKLSQLLDLVHQFQSDGTIMLGEGAEDMLFIQLDDKIIFVTPYNASDSSCEMQCLDDINELAYIGSLTFYQVEVIIDTEGKVINDDDLTARVRRWLESAIDDHNCVDPQTINRMTHEYRQSQAQQDHDYESDGLNEALRQAGMLIGHH